MQTKYFLLLLFHNKSVKLVKHKGEQEGAVSCCIKLLRVSPAVVWKLLVPCAAWNQTDWRVCWLHCKWIHKLLLCWISDTEIGVAKSTRTEILRVITFNEQNEIFCKMLVCTSYSASFLFLLGKHSDSWRADTTEGKGRRLTWLQ